MTEREAVMAMGLCGRAWDLEAMPVFAADGKRRNAPTEARKTLLDQHLICTGERPHDLLFMVEKSFTDRDAEQALQIASRRTANALAPLRAAT